MNRILCRFAGIFVLSFSLSGCDDALDLWDYRISGVNADYDNVKRIWEYCTQCLASKDCSQHRRRRCEDNTIEAIKSTMGTALARGKIDTVRYLVEVVGLDVNAPLDENQRTALHICSSFGGPQDDAICRYLVSKGANVNAISIKAPDSKGTPNSRTPLLVSIRKHNYINAVFLLEHGADPGIRTAGNMDACEYAFRVSNWPILPHLPGCCQRFRDGQLEEFRLELPDRPPQPSNLCR